MLQLSDYEYDLPPELIAQKPLSNRDSSMLLVLDRATQKTEIRVFRDITDYISSEDIIVINETKVIPARLFGKKNGSQIEIFLLSEIEENVWEVMVRPGRKARKGDIIDMGENVFCRIEDVQPGGNRIAVFESESDIYDFIDRKGKMPLPPYIKRTADESDRKRYQTIYAKDPGAVAAPTAGLHFTETLMDSIRSKGAGIAKITLHVGAGTFRPIKSETIEEHKMHNERFCVTRENAEMINEVKRKGGKVFAVGTTTVRTLESAADESGRINASEGTTDIFIYPGYRFKAVDHMITNFHLPRSSLLLMVSAFSSLEMIKNSYELAVKENLRFYSYGDAMLIL